MMLTRQEIFDKSATHLLTQGVKSVADEPPDGDVHVDFCMYRGPGGCKCAIGVFIPDESYAPQLEGLTVDSREVCSVLRAAGVDMTDEGVRDLAYALQGCHDRNGPESWARELRKIAKDFKLSSKCIEEFKK